MNPHVYKKTLACLLTCLYGSLATAQEQQLPLVNIEAKAETLQQQKISIKALNNKGTTETGNLLRQINGVNASRMGGHGLEPVIRGQSQRQLNVILDGATIRAGCPNRMDPPTSYSEVNSYDEIIVIKGVASVENAAGGSGGSLIFKRNKPNYEKDKLIHGKLSILKSNTTNVDANADLKAVAEQGYLSLQASKKQGNNYQDGNNDTVGASFDTTQGNVELGWTPSKNNHLKVAHEISNTADAVFPGAKMDSPKSDGTINRLAYDGKNLSQVVDGVEFNVFQSKVDHVMNNFALRTPPSAMMKRETLTNTTTTGGKLKLTSNFANSKLKYGVQQEDANQDATFYNRNNDQSIFLMWPDVTTQTNSIFVEADTDLEVIKLTTGLRYDAINAKAAKADETTDSGNQSSALYNSVYNAYNGDNSADEQNVSGLIRATGEFSSLGWFTGISHTKRTASATERFLAKGGSQGGLQSYWLGNPNIKPEQHNQLDLGISQKLNSFTWEATIWYDKVDDYILRDLAKNQYHNGINTFAKELSEVYVNIDAQLYGSDISFNWLAMPTIKLTSQISYTAGKNVSDKRNISSLPPVNGNFTSEYYTAFVVLGARLNFALGQDTIDNKYTPVSKFGKTPAWSTIDMYSETEVTKNWLLKVGVDNIFDHAYYQAINRGSFGTAFKLNEPGRNIWLKIAANF
jgi:iron complex outermembrane receptor protein